ncbi:MAG: hypothetical protein QOI63_1316 [Thermoplasmata archaeon]|jgi:hypothetical protein|nr:hypothetical protein [Thermoplasmata archaeon]
MQLVDIERKLLRWGHGYGIRLTADEIRRLGLAEGELVHATVQEAVPRSDTAAAALFRFKGPYDIRAILDDEAGT